VKVVACADHILIVLHSRLHTWQVLRKVYKLWFFFHPVFEYEQGRAGGGHTNTRISACISYRQLCPLAKISFIIAIQNHTVVYTQLKYKCSQVQAGARAVGERVPGTVGGAPLRA
jgi:hypothetical protein